MERKKALKDVLDLCKQGKFKEALDIIQNVDGEIGNKWLISIIIGCCNCCVANNSSPEKISEDDLYNLLNHIVSYMKDVEEAELLSYLQSLFHILKIFIHKKCYRLLTVMESILVPSFLTTPLPRKHITTYESSASLLHNFVVRTENREFQSSIVKICSILSNMYATTSNASALLSTSFNCAICLSNLSCPTEYLKSHYFLVLSLVRLDTMKVDTDQDFKSFLSHFTLIYNKYFKELCFKEAAKFYKETFILGKEIFNNDDCISILTLLRFPLVLLPVHFEDKLESLIKHKKTLTNLHNASYKQLVGNKLHSLMHTVVFSYCKSANGSEWCELSQACQLELLQFIWDLARLELLSKYTCSCKCLIDRNIYQAFCYSQYVCTLLEISVRQKNTSSDYNKEGANLLSRFCGDIKTLKQYNCEKWKAAWNALGMALYNIGVHLYQNSNEGCLHYFYILIKYFIKFEVQNANTILKFSMIGSAFAVVCNYNAHDYKKCLAFSALAMKLCPSQRKTFMTNWIKAKVSQRDAKTPEGCDVQKLTVISAFKQFKKEMEFLTDGANLLTANDKIDMLVFELEQYKAKWKSKVPMMSALKELCELGDLDKIVEVIIAVFGDCELILHEDVPKILQKIMRRYEERVLEKEDATIEPTVFLAILNYMNYKYRVKDVVTKNTDDMERTMNAEKSDEPPDAIPKDPNEKCDIVSFYDSLNLSRYFGVMKCLNESLDLFASVIKDDYDSSIFTKVTSSILYDLLIKMSFEYRLHRYTVKILQALQIALKVAMSENSACDIVQAIGFIIEISDVKKCYVKHLMSLADKQLQNIEITRVRNLKIVLTYYICKSKSLLYEDYKESYRIFQLANELYDAQEDKLEFKLIKSQLHLLHYKFVLMPCSFKIVDHETSTLLTIHLANSTVYEVYNSSKLDSSYGMSILLDANEELAKLNYLLKCPREVRAYCKETIILAQQLVLPIRCAYYLVYLAYADLRSLRYDDGQVKIEGLAGILCLTKYNTPVDEENKTPRDSEIEKVTKDLQEVTLELPVPSNYKKQLSPSSPTLVIQPFHLPAFEHHEDGCDCFYCISLEYQSLVLQKTRLDAMLHIKRKNFSISHDFFLGALKLYESCSRKYESYKETVAKFISHDLVPDFTKVLIEAYGFTLVDYSYHLTRTGNKTEAVKVTNKLIELVSSRKVEFMYLYHEALFQKMVYIVDVPPVAPVVNKVPEMETLCPESNNMVSTTPESKQSKVTVSAQCSPTFSPPKRRVKKCLPFNLSPDQDVLSTSNPGKTSPVPKQSKTPAPKIKIYVNDATGQKSKNLTKTRDKKKMTLFDDSGPSFSGVLSTPSASYSVNPENGLKSRTKLLTSKLQQSTKKVEVPTVSISDDSVDQAVAPKSKKKLALRKNLFDQTKVESEPSVPHGGAIRKSTRHRKV